MCMQPEVLLQRVAGSHWQKQLSSLGSLDAGMFIFVTGLHTISCLHHSVCCSVVLTGI